jgi:hypothetical protein
MLLRHPPRRSQKSLPIVNGFNRRPHEHTERPLDVVQFADRAGPCINKIPYKVPH